DGGAARRTGHQHRLPVLHHYGWRHGTEHALARLDLVGLSTDQTIHIGRARFGREVIHLVVEQEARTWHHDAVAVAAVQGSGDGHGIAVSVDNGVMGRLRTFRRPVAGEDFLAVAGVFHVH